MNNYALSQEKYTYTNALFWGNCTEHFRIASSGIISGQGSLRSHLAHLMIATAELLPIISQIVSIFEMYIASSASNQMPPRPVPPLRPLIRPENPVLPEEITGPILQLRAKLCSPENFPPFLKAHDKGLSLDEALQGFERLWNTHDRDMILSACVNQELSIGGNVMFRLAGQQGVYRLFEIIGTDILKEEEHGQIDKHFKAYFSCHYLEAAIVHHDLDRFQALLDIPEVREAITAEGIGMPGHCSVGPSGNSSICPFVYLQSKISGIHPTDRRKFIFILRGEYQNIDPDWLEICVIEDYLTDHKDKKGDGLQDQAIERVKSLISKSPNAALSDNLPILRLYMEMLMEGRDMAGLFPQGNLAASSLEQRLSFLFFMQPEEIKATIDELSQDIPTCERLTSKEIDNWIYNCLERKGRASPFVHRSPEMIEEALKTLYHLINDPSLREYKKLRSQISRFFWDLKIPLKTWALIARNLQMQSVFFPYFPYMHSIQIQAIIPQLSKETLLQYIKERLFFDFDERVLLAATKEQLDYLIDHFTIPPDDLSASINQCREKLKSLQDRDCKTDKEAKSMYWELDCELLDSLVPLSEEFDAKKEPLKAFILQLEKCRNRYDLSKMPEIEKLRNRMFLFHASAEEAYVKAGASVADLRKLAPSYNIEIPSAYCCLIGYDLMRNPYIDKYGDIYEAKDIMKWIAKSPTSPFGKGPLNTKDLKAHTELKKEIDTWRKANGDLSIG